MRKKQTNPKKSEGKGTKESESKKEKKRNKRN